MKILTTTSLLFLANTLFSQVTGCTDSHATNFNANATQNDGSCVYSTTTIVPQHSFVLSNAIDETSGLILFDDVLLTHNDDSDTKLYQLDLTNGSTMSTVQIPTVSNVDWEDIAQDEHYIYIGDFGNNATGIRTDMKIYRFLKPEWENPTTIDTIQFSYETQTDFTTSAANATNFDCEAFIVTEDKIYLFTKEWISNATSIFELEKAPGQQEAVLKGTLNVEGLITGATHFEEKKLIALSGYSTSLSPFVYLLYDFDGSDFLSGNKRKINLNLPFHQVEGIATADGLNYYISNEKFSQSIINVEQKLHKFDLSPYLDVYFFPEILLVDKLQATTPFRVYPNPITDGFHVLFPEFTATEHITFELIDPTGKSIFKNILKSKNQQFELGAFNLKSGFYTVLFENATTNTQHVVSIFKQ